MYAQNSILCQFGPRNLSSVQQLISQPILIHFWWELYHDHPELDTSEILEGDMATKYLTMVGQLQWLVTWGDLTSMLK